MDNKELIAKINNDLNKILKGTTEASDGLMNTEQSNAFIKKVVDQSEFLSLIGVENMRSAVKEINLIGMANRAIRKGVKGTAPDATAWNNGKRTLTSVETVLAVNISFDDLEDMIEEDNVENTITDIMVTTFGNDMADLGINGDESQVGDNFLKINDGIIELLTDDDEVNQMATAWAGDTKKKAVLAGIMAAMPNKWKRNVNELRFLCSPSFDEEYRDEIGERNTALGDTATTEATRVKHKGVIVEPIGFWPDDVVVLTNPQNIKLGIHKRNMRLGRFINERTRSVELTLSTRADFNYALSEAIAMGVKA